MGRVVVKYTYIESKWLVETYFSIFMNLFL